MDVRSPSRSSFWSLHLGTLCWLVLLVIAIAWGPQKATGQQSVVNKLTLRQITDLVSHGVPDSTMHTEILRRGLAFTPDSAAIAALSSKGAGPLTLSAIETFFPHPSGIAAVRPSEDRPSGAMAVSPDQLPPPTGYVNDFAGLLTPRVREEIEDICRQLNRTADAQVAVVTLSSMDANETIDQFSKDLFNKWGIGRKETNRGVLVLLIPSARKYRISVGYGLEGILTDARSAEIGHDMTPFLRSGDYDHATRLGVREIVQVITAH